MTSTNSNPSIIGSDTGYADMKAAQEDPNKIEVDLVTGCFYNNMKKLVKSTFHEFYLDILTRISTDYQIDLEELKENYPMEIKVYKKKPKDPAMCCLATIKKTGLQCGNSKKEGHNYCGVHLRSKDAPSNTYSDRGKTGPSGGARGGPSGGAARGGGRASPKKKLNLKPSYSPREESPEESARREKHEVETAYQLNEDESVNESVNELKPEPIEDTDDGVDVEVETIDGRQYIVCQRNIYHYPVGGLGDMGLEDLEFVGLKQTDGTIEWK